MKKLLICSHAYVSPENLVKPKLLSKKFKVGLVVPKRWQAMGRQLVVESEKLRGGDFRTFAISTFFSGNGGKYVYNPLSLFLVFIKFRPDILYVEEEPWTPSAFELMFLAKLVRVKKKAIFSWENLDLPLAWWQKMIKKFVLTQADLAVAGNKEAKGILEGYIAQLGRKIPVRVNAQFGVDTSHFRPISKRTPSKVFTIGFVGRFVKAKGIDTLIEALALLPKDCRLLLVSTTTLPKQFEGLAERLNVRNRIKIIEGKPHQDLPGYLNKMDVFVLPSKTTKTWKEQFGRVLIEAMACQLPVIGSNSGAISEVLSKAGLIFNEGDPHDLAKKILKLKKDKVLLRDFGKSGYQRVLKKYTHQAVVSRLIKIIS